MNDNRHVCLTVCVFFSHLREAASGYRKRGGLRPQKVQPTNPQLFDDTSTQPPLAYSQPPPHGKTRMLKLYTAINTVPQIEAGL